MAEIDTDKAVIAEKADVEKIVSSEGCIDTNSDFYIDPVKEKALLLKFDLGFTPIFMLLYLSCFLDRGNIGNVKVAGIIPDINAATDQFSTAVSIFYATYLLTTVCVVWSLTTIFTGFITNIGGLYATRLILGACEAGLFPCLNLYLTMIYKRHEMAKRVSYLFVCTALSGAFGGLLAYALLLMQGVAGKAGWRWVYIIEGIFSISCVLAIWFSLPNEPSTAWFLNEDDKELMRRRSIEREQYMGSEKFDWKEVKIAFRDPKLYLSGVIQFCQDILLYGFSTFLPSILSAMGYSSLQSNYLTIPVYVFGAIVFLIVASLSDRYSIRGPCIFMANWFGIVGYIILLTCDIGAVRYFATYMCAVAVYVGPGLNLAWLNVNVAPHYRRATAIGFQQTMGNSAGIVAGQIYRAAPYTLGNAFSLGAVCLSQMVIVAKYLYLKQQNSQKAKIQNGDFPDSRNEKSGNNDLDFSYHL